MNNIDMILQSADLPESPVDAISDERQAKILSGALMLARQDAKKRSRRRVVRIAAAAAMRTTRLRLRFFASCRASINAPLRILACRSSEIASTGDSGRSADCRIISMLFIYKPSPA